MRSTRRLVPILLAVLLAGVVVTRVAAAQEYTDPTGDSGAAPDVSTVSVTNDNAKQITFRITTVAPQQPDDGTLVLVDADRNPATGLFGSEFWLFDSGFFGHVAGGAFVVDFRPPPSFRSTVNGNVLEISINSVDLAGTESFGFQVQTIGTGDATDTAPDSGWFTYDLSYPQCSNGKDDDGDGNVDAADLGCSGTTDEDESDEPVNIRLGKAKTTPARPKAGKTAVVSAPATRVETGQALDGGTVKCTAKIVGGGAVRGTGGMAGGRAVCKLKVPATAKNKTVRGQIAVTYETASAKTPFVFRTAR